MIIFNFEYHFLFAVLSLLLTSKYVIHLNFAAAIGCILSFYLPDIDHVESKVGRRIPIVSWLINFVCGHRGITHSLIACLAVSTLAAALGNDFAYGVLIGYGSHILSDAFTRQGVPLVWPIPWRFRIPFFYRFGLLTKIGLVLLMVYYIMEKSP